MKLIKQLKRQRVKEKVKKGRNSFHGLEEKQPCTPRVTEILSFISYG